MTDVLGTHDAVALAAMVRSGATTPLELAEAAIARIEAIDPQLNAVIHPLFDKARDQAASPDLPDGPFRGVPIVIKDLWASTAGDPMHNGIAGMRDAGYIHPTDSDLVALYRDAGFIFVGRTNTPELGLVATTEPLSHGPCRNPWNTAYGTGGSSGGSAAAVAAGLVPVGNASDGGGSIRIPAALCGLVGLKPSRGRVPMGPLGDEWGVSIQHIVSHTVRDTAAVLDISSVHFPGDGVIAPGPTRPYADEVGVEPGPLRIALLDSAVRPDVETDPACSAAARAVAETLASLGHDVTEHHPPALGDVGQARSFLASWSVRAAANLDRVGAMIGRKLTADDVEPSTWMMAEWGRSATGLDLITAQSAMSRFRRDVADWWQPNCDLLVSPTTARPAPPIGELTSTVAEPQRGSAGSIPYATFTAPFNVTGQPAISLPLAMTDDGLPIGVQIVAAYGREDLLIQVAAQLERELPWSGRIAPLHPMA